MLVAVAWQDAPWRSRSRAGYRIEGYDISNISGTSAVGSMVVFEDGEPNKNEYRKFKIRSIFQPNDVGMLKEVLERRFAHAAVPAQSEVRGRCRTSCYRWRPRAGEYRAPRFAPRADKDSHRGYRKRADAAIATTSSVSSQRACKRQRL